MKLLEMEEDLTDLTNQLFRHSKFLKNDTELERIRALFRFKREKPLSLQQVMRYGSFNEHCGGYSSRFFQPSSFVVGDSSRRLNESHFDIKLDQPEKMLDVDVGHYRTIPVSEKRSIIDIPDSPGYVFINGSKKILQKLQKHKDHPLKNANLLQLLTKDKYLNSSRFQDKADDKMTMSAEMFSEINKTILEEDLFVGYSEKKTNSLIENNYKLKDEQPNKFWTAKFNKVRLLRTSWWPESVQEWKTRSRHWPNQKLIDQVSRFVFLKPAKGGKRFKYWFSHIERILAGLRTREQKLNYFLLKIIFSRFLKPISPGHLYTFQIKSIMMFTCERYPPDHPSWKEIDQEKDTMLREMLSQLLQAFQEDHLPNYFITQVNVLKNISKPIRRKVVRILKQILETDNILRLLPTEDIETVVSFLEHIKTIMSKLNMFVKRTLKVGILNIISDHPQFWMKFGKKEVTKKVKKSGILTKLIFVFSITCVLLLFGYLIYFISKKIFWK